MNFLSLVRDSIREGLLFAPEEFRHRHAAWLAARQTQEGGFANRRGRADLYYTAFGLRALSALNELTPEIAENATRFLLAQFNQPDTVRLRQPHGAFSDAVAALSWWDSL